ncbi:MAG: sigma-54 dependent transcriptional regulator [Chloroherpetonaceae bacterium]|nr:sigma-54 dependent transcriptional regulator [Chloroherpetonaceae bacterium]MDW8436974.1 sigma-54 dependent transcriptional regulator [Chloroherpetonaceae bacterium]
MQNGTVIIGNSPKILEALALAEQVAKTDVTVLITGESGTGKEVFARFIHEKSARASQKFIPINCGALPQGVLEAELFGHEKGAFTGAVAQRKGYFESADGGTIFLDEIGEMSLETQVKLLRVLETGEYMRVGSSETRRANVRIIAATNRRLDEEVQKKRFREDLYFRLRAVELKLPPLRERKQDILLLAEKFIRDFEKKHRLKFVGFTSDATELLLDYEWHGNVRELRNVIESLVVLERGEKITAETLMKYLQPPPTAPVSHALVPVQHSVQKSADHLIQQELIYRALLQLQADMNEVKSLLRQLSERQATLEPKRDAQLLLPEPQKPREETLRDLLRAFYDSRADENNPPSLQELERYAIEQTLKRVGGSRRKAAKLLGITERTLYRKINEYDLRNPKTKD